jgi:hypothetical protein
MVQPTQGKWPATVLPLVLLCFPSLHPSSRLRFAYVSSSYHFLCSMLRRLHGFRPGQGCYHQRPDGQWCRGLVSPGESPITACLVVLMLHIPCAIIIEVRDERRLASLVSVPAVAVRSGQWQVAQHLRGRRGSASFETDVSLSTKLFLRCIFSEICPAPPVSPPPSRAVFFHWPKWFS